MAKQPPKPSRKQVQQRRKKPSAFLKGLKWIVALAAVAGVVYAASQLSSGVAYGENALPAINFSALSSSEKTVALQAANRARCTCGCGLGLAQCVATDATCPIRESNLDRIRTMVRNADKP